MNIAIIGCGAVFENIHLPVLKKIENIKVICLIDPDKRRVGIWARKLGASHCDNVQSIPPSVTAALVAVPNHLHLSVTEALLAKGIHVLCEKPMAISFDECKRMIDASVRFKKRLMINHVYRFHRPVCELRRILDEGLLGGIQRVDMALGSRFAWPSKTGFYSDRKQAGGGVLMDLGCHLIELALWLFGPIEGVEAVSLYERGKNGGLDLSQSVNVSFKSGVKGVVRLSRLDRLANEIKVIGSLASCSVSLDEDTMLFEQSDHMTLCQRMGALLRMNGTDKYENAWRTFLENCDKESAFVERTHHAAEAIRWVERIYDCEKRLVLNEEESRDLCNGSPGRFSPKTS